MSQQPPSDRYPVLIVEDEPLLRLMAYDMVMDAGFDPVEAADADDAVRILQSRTDIRIVFTDIDMPGGADGMKLAAIIRDRWPPIEIILTSGKRTPRIDEMPARVVFFSKPYRRDEIVGAMRKFMA